MNREIKFRVWDGEKMLSLGQAYEKELVSIDFQRDYLRSEYEHVKLMQYTGLKDKNGNEICEGDILESNENNEVYVIGEFTPLSRHLDLLADNVGYFEGTGKKRRFQKRSAGGANHLDDWVSNPEFYKLIGNIYENPELINP